MNDERLLAMSAEEFNKLVTQAFTDYRNGHMLALSTSPLADSSLTAPCFLEGEPVTDAVRGQAMGSVLHWGVDTLKPGGTHSWIADQWSHHNVLSGYYLYMPQEHEKHFTIEKLAEQMAISIGTFHNWRENAFNLVGQQLQTELATPQAAEKRQRYAFADRYAALLPDEQRLLRVGAIFRAPIPTELLEKTANEAQNATMQESIHTLVTTHLLSSNEERTQVSVHPQMRSYLLTLLPPQERQQSHQAAGSHYEEQQAYLEAAHHFRRGRAYEPAAQILMTHYQYIIDNNQVGELRDMLDEFQSAELYHNSFMQLHLVAGQAAEFMGDLNGALQKYGQALSAKDVYIKAEAYYQRAKILQHRNIDEAVAYYQKGIQLLKERPLRNPLLLGRMYIYLAWIFIEERPNFDLATAHLTRAERLVDPTQLEEWADLHNAWGGLFRHKKELQLALKHRLEAWLAANELQDLDRMIKIGHNLGTNYIRLRQYERALEYLQEGLALAIKAKNKQMEGPYNDQIGACYYWLEQYEEALRYYKMAYEIHVEVGNDNRLTHCCYNIAEVYIDLARTAEARPYFNEGVALAKKLGDERMSALFDKLLPQTELNERQQKGVEHVKQHGEIANRTYREVTGASQKQARNDLKDLVEKGVFKKVGKGRSLRYVLAESGK